MNSESPLAPEPSPSSSNGDATSGSFNASPRRGGRWKKAAMVIAVVAALSVAASYFDLSAITGNLVGAKERLGIWFPVLFIAVYVAATVLFIPASALTLVAGGLFGLGMGSVYVSIASTLGATLAFLLGRHTLRRLISSKIAGNEKFSAIDDAVGKEGWKIVGLTRLSPAFPFGLLNYAYGLTKVPLSHYVLASWIGMMPGTVLYVYLGAVGKAAVNAQGRTSGEWAMLTVGLAATAAVTIYVTRVARKALNQRLTTPTQSEA